MPHRENATKFTHPWISGGSETVALKRTLAEYETKLKNLMEDSVTTIGEIETLRIRNSFLEMKNSELQNEISRLQALNDQYLGYKKLHEDDVALIHNLEQNIKRMEAALTLNKERVDPEALSNAMPVSKSVTIPMVMEKTENELIFPRTGHLKFGDELISASLNCQSLPEFHSLSSSSIQNDIDFLSNDEEMQIDKETTNTESVTERIGEGFIDPHTSQCIPPQNSEDQSKEGRNVKGRSEEDTSHSNISELSFLAFIQNQSIGDANFFSKEGNIVEACNTESARVCEEKIPLCDVTTYNPEDQFKISAESLIDFMLLKNSKEDDLDARRSEGSGLTAGKSCSLDYEIDDSQINSSETEKHRPLLPSDFHDNTRPNTHLSEDFDAIQRVRLREIITRDPWKRNVNRESKYSLRNGPPEKLNSLTFRPRIRSALVRFNLPFKSALDAVNHYECYQISYKDRLNTLRSKANEWLKEDNPIADVLNELKDSMEEDSFDKLAVSSVIKTLTNREFMPDKTYLLYYVFHYIYSLGCSLDDAMIMNFSLHRHEKIVLSALFEVDKMKKRYLNGFIAGAVQSLHLLIFRKRRLLPRGVLALCRVFTEICRQKNLVQKPVSLAVDLLKGRHGYATLITASMVSIWSEPFEVTEAIPDEEKCLHSAISLGVSKWHFNKHRMHPKLCEQGIYKELLEASLKILDKQMCPVPDKDVLVEVIEYLFAKIHLEHDNGSSLNVESILFAPILIFASFSDWKWVEKKILEQHVIPSLSKYAEEQNESAFAVFCDLCAEIFSYSSLKPCECALIDYYRDETITEGDNFLRDCAAVSLIRLLVLRRQSVKIRYALSNWLQENTQNSRTKSLMHFMEKGFIRSSADAMILVKEDF